MNRPPSDHWDGARFHNPGAPPPRHGAGRLLRWLLRPDRAPWPDRVVDPPYPAPPDRAAPGTVAATFVNHSTFLLRFPGLTVLTDPIFAQRCSPVGWAGPRRHRAPGLALDALPRIGLVVLSHNHYDHLDLASLRVLRDRFAPQFVTMLGNAAFLSRHGIAARELDWWEQTTCGSLRVTATPARHFAARTPFDRNRTLWGGFMMRDGAGQVLFAGDSGTGPHWNDIRDRLGAPGLALLPIGAYEPRWFMSPVHMDPAEAVEAHLDLEARYSLGMHFGTFQLTAEAIDAPERALRAACHAAEVHAFTTLGFGETRIFPLATGRAT